MTTLPPRLESRQSGPNGEPALLIESFDVAPGDSIQLRFDAQRDRWRQGVFIATDGQLALAGVQSPAMTIWSDTAPSVVKIDVISTQGRIVFYNIWNSGRARAGFESQSATSGMLIRPRGDGWTTYRCNDIGHGSDFDSVTFSIRVVAQA